MLSQEENELICRVGPGTPMGNLFREYWLPAMLTRGAARAGQRPVRVLMLGEQLIAFRDTNGKVGLLPEQLPASRRVAVLRAQRRSRPALRVPRLEVRHRRQLHRHAQRARRVGLQVQSQSRGVSDAGAGRHRLGVSRPALDAASAARISKATCCPGAQAWAYQQSANWFQILEGHIDTAHVSFLHYGGIQPEDVPTGTFSEYQLRQRSAHFEVIDTEGGAAYAARRPACDGPDVLAHRAVDVPVVLHGAARRAGLGKRNACEVPLDDNHTITYQMSVSRGRPGGNGPNATHESDPDAAAHHRLVRPLSAHRSARQRLPDRSRGAARRTGAPPATPASAASPCRTPPSPPAWGRSTTAREHLGTSDAMVIRVRRRLLAAIRAHMQNGTVPPGVDDPRRTACERAACCCPKAPTGWKPRASCARRSSSTRTWIPR